MSILKYENVEWALPFLFGQDIKLFKIMAIFEKLDVKSFKVNSFGAIKCKWSGGRRSVIQTQDRGFIERLFRHLRKIGITPSLTFTNYHIPDEDLNDELCNFILDIGNELGCNFIISSDRLFNYVKKRYPEMYCTASVIKPIFEFQDPKKKSSYSSKAESDFYNMLLDKYNKVVVRPEFARRYLIEDTHGIKDISRIEVLLNQRCSPDCPKALEHYIFTEAYELDKLDSVKDFSCYNESLKHIQLINPESNLYFTTEEVDNLVNNIGIRHLKLQGREVGMQTNLLLFNIYTYLLKPGGNSLIFQDLLEVGDPSINKFFHSEIINANEQIC